MTWWNVSVEPVSRDVEGFTLATEAGTAMQALIDVASLLADSEGQAGS